MNYGIQNIAFKVYANGKIRFGQRIVDQLLPPTNYAGAACANTSDPDILYSRI